MLWERIHTHAEKCFGHCMILRLVLCRNLNEAKLQILRSWLHVGQTTTSVDTTRPLPVVLCFFYRMFAVTVMNLICTIIFGHSMTKSVCYSDGSASSFYICTRNRSLQLDKRQCSWISTAAESSPELCACVPVCVDSYLPR